MAELSEFDHKHTALDGLAKRMKSIGCSTVTWEEVFLFDDLKRLPSKFLFTINAPQHVAQALHNAINHLYQPRYFFGHADYMHLRLSWRVAGRFDNNDGFYWEIEVAPAEFIKDSNSYKELLADCRVISHRLDQLLAVYED